MLGLVTNFSFSIMEQDKIDSTANAIGSVTGYSFSILEQDEELTLFMFEARWRIILVYVISQILMSSFVVECIGSISCIFSVYVTYLCWIRFACLGEDID